MIEASPYPHVAYILRSYPRLSQTFILNEILALEQIGLRIHIFAITDPQETVRQGQVADVRAPVNYLEAAHRRRAISIIIEHLLVLLPSPYRYLKTLFYVLRHKELDTGYTAGSRYACFVQAVYLTRLLGRRQQGTVGAIDHLHAHFAHAPTLIALLTRMLTGISYSFTAHARDLYQIPKTVLAERVNQARVVITCCGSNLDYLREVVPQPLQSKVHLVHHGVNLQGFHPDPTQTRLSEIPLILSVGRLIEKKGFPDLLLACQQLAQAGYRFRCLIYGDGPLRDDLAGMIKQLGLEHDVMLAGACSQQELLPVFQRADIFALTPFVTEDGDRDGVPNVLVEAMACGVPVVSTAVAGIPELVTHNHNGLLAEPHDVNAITVALAALLDDESERKRLGAAARQTVVEDFDLRWAAQELATLFSHAETRESWLRVA